MDSSSAVTMLSQFRQRLIRETQGGCGRKTDPGWAYRRRLITAHERLRPETFSPGCGLADRLRRPRGPNLVGLRGHGRTPRPAILSGTNPE